MARADEPVEGWEEEEKGDTADVKMDRILGEDVERLDEEEEEEEKSEVNVGWSENGVASLEPPLPVVKGRSDGKKKSSGRRLLQWLKGMGKIFGGYRNRRGPVLPDVLY